MACSVENFWLTVFYGLEQFVVQINHKTIIAENKKNFVDSLVSVHKSLLLIQRSCMIIKQLNILYSEKKQQLLQAYHFDAAPQPSLHK